MNEAFTYYVYSMTIARSNGLQMEIKNHKTDSWEIVREPIMWKRIQEEGILVSEEKAEKLYHEFHDII